MILLADVLAVEAGPGPSWPVLVSTGATLALLVATFWQARALAALRDAVRKLQEPPPVAPPAGTTGRGSKPMFAGLYAEKSPSPLESLGSVPGGPILMVAGMLALVALGLGLAGGSNAPPADMASKAGLTSLRAELDSVSGMMRNLGDSLRLVTAPGPKPAPVAAKPATARRLASRPPVIPAAPRILPAPSLPGAP